MFVHLYLYRLKCLLRDKQLVFWTLAFPMILGTLFFLAFGKLGTMDQFSPINIAVVTNEAYDTNPDFQTVLDEVSAGDDRMFNLTKATEAEAETLLSTNKVIGYILPGTTPTVIIRASGIEQNIVKIFLEQYTQTTGSVKKVITMNPQQMSQVIADATTRVAYTKEVAGSSAEPNIVLNYFYTLIAMACMYGSFWGMKEITDIQANLSARAARMNMMPVHKLKALLVNLLAALSVQYLTLLALLAYLRFVLNIDFGSKTGYVLLTTFIGAIVGIMFGAFVSVITKQGEGVKVAILIGVSMLGSFLAGMMYDQMKYIVAQKAPLLGYINPVNLLTDAFYCLYYYDSYTRYWSNIGMLGLFIFGFGFLTYLKIRRQKYASL